MLTKALLKYSVRQKKVFPKFVDPKKEPLLKEASRLIHFYEGSPKKMVSALEEELSPYLQGPATIGNGLNKLLSERLVFSQKLDQEALLAFRNEVVFEAQNLRREKLFPTLDAFYETLQDRLGKNLQEVQKELYSDLPECQEIESFKPITPEKLLNRYNVALVQGLLIHASKLQVTLKAPDMSLKRALFRHLKFHRLLCDVLQNDEKSFIFELSGPLSLFSQRQTYGLRLANFFPYLLEASSWAIKAELVLKGNEVNLALDNGSQLEGHYSLRESYLPKELLSFVESFNKKDSTWQARSSSEFLNMGEKSYCFPDVELKKDDGTVLYLELFHRWHGHQLLARLKHLERQKKTALILGVCKHIREKKEFKELSLSSFSKGRILEFNEFPTATKVRAFLKEL